MRYQQPSAEQSGEGGTVRWRVAMRAKVEHPFLAVKRRFGYAKVRYRDLAKNRERLTPLLGAHEPARGRATQLA